MNIDKRLIHETPRGALALTVSTGIGAGALLIGQAYLLSQIVSRVFLDGHTLTQVGGRLGALVGISVARAGLLWGGEVAANRAAGQVKRQMRERLFRHLTALGPVFVRGERTGELVNTAVKGIEELDAYFSQYLPQLALAVLIPLVTLLFVFPIDPLSGVVLLVTAPLIPFFMMLIGSLASALSRRQWTTLSRMSAHFLDVLQGLTTLKLLGRSRDQIQTITRISDRFREATMGVLRVAFLSALVLEMLATISTAVIAVEIGLRLLYDKLPFDEAFFVLILAPEFYLPLRLLGTRFHAGIAGATAAARMFEVLEQAPRVSSTATDWIAAVQTIRFENVRAAYEDRAALNGVSFEMQPGQKVALVGASGAGKSTVATLLLRLIDPSAGHIWIGDTALGTIPAKVWREQTAWVPQNPYLFAASVADNIRLARPAAPLDDVKRAAEAAHAADFIQRLPQGYETVIGERGARLSGGQAQRIALARAFLKDAPLLVLDEATSNLDPETETLVQLAIRQLMQGRTTLIIAHRLSTVQDADQIVVLENGWVAEVGNHASLVARQGVYYKLVSA